MKISDLRKISIRNNVRIRFRLPNGTDCVINEHGVAQIPSLHSVPDFRLEDQLPGVEQFTLEPAGAPDKRKNRDNTQVLSREQIAALTAPAAGAAAADDHEE